MIEKKKSPQMIDKAWFIDDKYWFYFLYFNLLQNYAFIEASAYFDQNLTAPF